MDMIAEPFEAIHPKILLFHSHLPLKIFGMQELYFEYVRQLFEQFLKNPSC